LISRLLIVSMGRVMGPRGEKSFLRQATHPDFVFSTRHPRTGPAVTWPEVKYPLEEYARENAEAEARSLADVERVIVES
jgi:hypothetical protein